MPNVHPIACDIDPRVEHRYARLQGERYKYLHASPESGEIKATIFLIHGWPDLSMGWRYQIPLLVKLGFRCIALDLLGFGGSDAPPVPPESISRYSLKAASDAIAELAQQLSIPKIVLGGHDWGGFVVYRCAQYHPELVSHCISICTPYVPPSLEYVPLEELVKRAPFLGYQLQLASSEVEDVVKGEEKIRQFLNGIYGARTLGGRFLFNAQKGLDLDTLPRLGKSPLLSDQELDYYVQEYSRHSSIHGTLNWYRTQRANYEDESSFLSSYSPSSAGELRLIDKPTLFIAGLKDPVLLPVLSQGMEKYWGSSESGQSLLLKKEVNAGHWAPWEDAEGVNLELESWLLHTVLGGSANRETGTMSKNRAVDKAKI